MGADRVVISSQNIISPTAMTSIEEIFEFIKSHGMKQANNAITTLADFLVLTKETLQSIWAWARVIEKKMRQENVHQT